MSIRVLVVDDAPFARKSLMKLIEAEGWEVAGEAGNGMEALNQYRELRPDLVTMDITMPEMDGLAATKMIVALDSTAKIIICSAVGQQDMVVEAMRAGAKDFVVKPFKKERVVAAISRAMGLPVPT